MKVYVGSGAPRVFFSIFCSTDHSTACAVVQAVDSVADTSTIPLSAADCRDAEALSAIATAAHNVVAKVIRLFPRELHSLQLLAFSNHSQPIRATRNAHVLVSHDRHCSPLL